MVERLVQPGGDADLVVVGAVADGCVSYLCSKGILKKVGGQRADAVALLETFVDDDSLFVENEAAGVGDAILILTRGQAVNGRLLR